jgi:1,4-dihydroxy-2-naphthoate octaprenyltransferase
MTFSSCALGGLLALAAGTFDGIAWAACLLGLLLAHATNNQLNDLIDSARGIDEGNYFRVQYGAHVLEDGLLTSRELWAYIGLTGSIALAFGLWLVWHVGSVIVPPLLLGAAFLLLYTWPLKQWGLGELAVLLVWGPLMTGGTYLATTGQWSWLAAMIGTLFALGPAAVIFGKHLDKLTYDEAKGIATLPVRLGAPVSRRCVQVMIALQYLSTGALVVIGWLPWSTLIVVAALPKARQLLQVYAHPAPTRCPEGYPESAWPLWYVAFAFSHTRLFGMLFLLGLVAAWLTGHW